MLKGRLQARAIAAVIAQPIDADRIIRTARLVVDLELHRAADIGAHLGGEALQLGRILAWIDPPDAHRRPRQLVFRHNCIGRRPADHRIERLRHGADIAGHGRGCGQVVGADRQRGRRHPPRSGQARHAGPDHSGPIINGDRAVGLGRSRHQSLIGENDRIGRDHRRWRRRRAQCHAGRDRRCAGLARTVCRRQCRQQRRRGGGRGRRRRGGGVRRWRGGRRGLRQDRRRRRDKIVEPRHV